MFLVVGVLHPMSDIQCIYNLPCGNPIYPHDKQANLFLSTNTQMLSMNNHVLRVTSTPNNPTFAIKGNEECQEEMLRYWWLAVEGEVNRSNLTYPVRGLNYSPWWQARYLPASSRPPYAQCATHHPVVCWINTLNAQETLRLGTSG